MEVSDNNKPIAMKIEKLTFSFSKDHVQRQYTSITPPRNSRHNLSLQKRHVYQIPNQNIQNGNEQVHRSMEEIPASEHYTADEIVLASSKSGSQEECSTSVNDGSASMQSSTHSSVRQWQSTPWYIQSSPKNEIEAVRAFVRDTLFSKVKFITGDKDLELSNGEFSMQSCLT
jgi:hypothetical protein